MSTKGDVQAAMSASWVEVDPEQWIAEIQKLAPHVTIDNMAAKYRALPRAVWEEYGAWTAIKDEPYTMPWHVCWSFAIETMAELCREFGVNGCCTVIDYPGGHGYNIMAVSDDSAPTDPTKVMAFVWEPQEGAFVDLNSVGVTPYTLASSTVVVV